MGLKIQLNIFKAELFNAFLNSFYFIKFYIFIKIQFIRTKAAFIFNRSLVYFPNIKTSNAKNLAN